MSSFTLVESLKRPSDPPLVPRIHAALDGEICAFLNAKSVRRLWATLEPIARGIGCLARYPITQRDAQDALKTLLYAKAPSSPVSYTEMVARATPWMDKGHDEDELEDLTDEARIAERAAKLVSEAEPDAFAATPFTWTEPAELPQRAWLYGRHLIRKEIAATLAPGGVGKTSLGIAEALALVSGRNLLGVQPPSRLRVWLWNGEEPAEELSRRIMAACLHFGLSREDIGDRLYVDNGHDMPLMLAEETGDGTSINAPLVHDLAQALRARSIDVMIVDPFISTHSVTENNNNAIQKAVTAWKEVAVTADVAIDLAHHTRKLRGQEATAEDARGAGALIDKSRDARALNPMSDVEAVQLGVPAIDRFRYFWTGPGGKSNMAPKTGAKTWFQFISVELGNRRGGEAGDQVGVVAPWTPPAIVVEELDPGALAALESRMHGGLWRAAPQAAGKDEWIGVAVAEAFGINRTDADWIERAKRLIRRLEAEDFLQKEKVRDPQQRKEVSAFVFRRARALTADVEAEQGLAA